jgi:hypothetical protein
MSALPANKASERPRFFVPTNISLTAGLIAETSKLLVKQAGPYTATFYAASKLAVGAKITKVSAGIFRDYSDIFTVALSPVIAYKFCKNPSSYLRNISGKPWIVTADLVAKKSRLFFAYTKLAIVELQLAGPVLQAQVFKILIVVSVTCAFTGFAKTTYILIGKSSKQNWMNFTVAGTKVVLTVSALFIASPTIISIMSIASISLSLTNAVLKHKAKLAKLAKKSPASAPTPGTTYIHSEEFRKARWYLAQARRIRGL